MEATDCWETPQDLYDGLDAEFGFGLDVCALPCNCKCPSFLSPEDDALNRRWMGTCWMNPPYGKGLEKWVEKAYRSSLEGATVVCLLPARTETEWFHQYCLKGEVRFLRGRRWFTKPDGKTGRPRFGSMIVVFRPPKA